MEQKNLIIMILFISTLFVGGIFGGLVYYALNQVEDQLRIVDFVIPLATNSTTGAPNVTTFQDVLDLTIYPFFRLGDALPYLVYFMDFSFIIALALVSYLSSKNPIFFILHILYTFLITYFAIIIANAYQEILQDQLLNNIMTEFTVHNLLMLYFPQIFFITSFVLGAIAYVNVVKPSTKEHPYGINYGGGF